MSLLLFDELKRYVGFSPADGEKLRSALPLVAPHFERCAEAFYAHILEHEGSRAVLESGESRVGHLKVTLRVWMAQLFEGPWDLAYYERRLRIGRVHVRIKLPQHYMLTSMHGLRESLVAVLEAAGPSGAEAVTPLRKLVDIELAIMLRSYQEVLLTEHSLNDRLTTVGVLVGGVGHELRTPLSIISSSAHLARGQVAPETLEKHLGRIESNAARAQEILASLIDLVREAPLEPTPIGLAHTINDALKSIQVPSGVLVDVSHLPPALLTEGDSTQLRQVFVNLLQNAIDALGSTGTLKVSTEQAASRVKVFIDDSGPGIAPEIADTLFDPLVTTRPNGVGIGLALVKRLVERHRGSVTASASPLGGARFVVELPAIDAARVP